MKKRFSGKALKSITDYGAFFVGCAAYSCGLNAFLTPNKISPGGLTGIAAILNMLINVPTGFTLLVLNVPLLVWGLKKFGFSFLKKTVVATIMMSVLIDIGEMFIPQYLGNRLLAAVYGGVLSGFGLALVFMRGGTTGGTDVLAKIINLRFPFISMGRTMLFLDFVVILLAALAYRDIETGLYTIITIFVASKIIDSLLYGADSGKIAFIVSNKSDDITARIVKNLPRGVTALSGKGAYSKTEREVLMCAVRRQQVAKLRAIVKEIDPDAFMVIADAGEIIGEGFKRF